MEEDGNDRSTVQPKVNTQEKRIIKENICNALDMGLQIIYIYTSEEIGWPENLTTDSAKWI